MPRLDTRDTTHVTRHTTHLPERQVALRSRLRDSSMSLPRILDYGHNNYGHSAATTVTAGPPARPYRVIRRCRRRASCTRNMTHAPMQRALQRQGETETQREADTWKGKQCAPPGAPAAQRHVRTSPYHHVHTKAQTPSPTTYGRAGSPAVTVVAARCDRSCCDRSCAGRSVSAHQASMLHASTPLRRMPLRLYAACLGAMLSKRIHA